VLPSPPGTGLLLVAILNCLAFGVLALQQVRPRLRLRPRLLGLSLGV
jgi:hypothetical protein